MAADPRPNRIYLRRDTAANWTANNPYLALGELGVEADINNASRQARMKLGPGHWNDLPYFGWDLRTTDPTAGKMILNGRGMALYANSEDAQSIGSVIYVPGFVPFGMYAGSGGSSAADTFFYRNGVGEWTLQTGRILGTSVPTAAGHLTNKSYVDGTVLRKSNPQTINNSAVLVNDSALTTGALAINTRYDVRGLLTVTGPIAGDIKIQLTLPTGATFQGTMQGPPTTVATAPWNSVTYAAVHATSYAFGTIDTSTRTTIRLEGELNMGASTGTCVLQWAQNTAFADVTTMLAGSKITLAPR